ncbi:BON domain-containing protein [Hymenobacter arizonensis]|uniref:Osmotically-inducible protein OsmY, contains BON domain n=1 Tax=Hymenobacter arizonensis TaxID=1227077 RepID=A0A1I5UGU4_HYMAR|nr:BON domain-containing protein [Hymenobacter arizonensis]SFP94450.1 Osmotically-inducible protein OsmY, contains BON domain [Hymenobacter arizonensis]
MKTPYILTATAAPSETMADADITTAIERLFTTQKGLNEHALDVATHEGLVTLTGFTDNLLARQRAEEIALAVRGVRGVTSTVAVQTLDLPDADIQRDVCGALADDPATADYAVHCTVAGGVVTLTGMVQSWAERQLVLRVLQGVRGVTTFVTERLTIQKGEIVNSDAEITTQIRELLDWDIRVNSALVEVQTHEQVVHLLGTVGTATEKDHIVAIAYQTGAARVDAHDLLVAYWALGSELRGEKFAPRANEAIVKAVRGTIYHNPRVRCSETLVQAHEGVVTLAGTVSNLRARLEAERDARHVVGVHDVHNLLKIRPKRLVPDADIRQTILAALARDPYVGHFHFVVSVHQGQATVQGLVGSAFERERVGDVAAGASGVLALTNRVAQPGLAGPGTGSAAHAGGPNPDHALAGRIRQRHFWSASLHDQDIEVQVSHGRATLTGTVDTWPERQQAAADAYEVGARDVNNHLQVRTPAAPESQPAESLELLADVNH